MSIENSSANVKAAALPKKPLSAYNLFFQYNRIKLLESFGRNDIEQVERNPGLNCNLPGLEDIHPTSPILAAPAHEIKTFRKKVIQRLIDENPFRLSTQEKRSHGKIHGKMSFLEMSKYMGKKWKQADETTKLIFRELSNEGKAKFKKSLTLKYRFTCSKFYGAKLPLPKEALSKVSPDDFTSSHEVIGSSVPKRVLNLGEMNEMLQSVDWGTEEQQAISQKSHPPSPIASNGAITDDEFRLYLNNLNWNNSDC